MFHEDEVVQELSALPRQHHVAFAAACCERVLPDYEAFSLSESWGKSKVLRQALDLVWDTLRLNNLPAHDLTNFNKYIQLCEKQAPDSDKFSSMFVRPAQNAVGAIASTLECCLRTDLNKISLIRSLPVETLTVYLWTVNNCYLETSEKVRDIESAFIGDWGSLTDKEKVAYRLSEGKKLDQAFAEWLLQTPLMLAELKQQRRDIDLLKSVTVLDITTIDELIMTSREVGIRPIKRNLL